MEADGLRLFPVDDPEAAVLFGGARVWFLQVASFGLIELVEVSAG